MTEEDNKTAKKQKIHKELGIVFFILALVMIGVIFIFAMQFINPTIACGTWCPARKLPRETYDRVTEEIRSLIAGENLDTSNLERFISSYAPSDPCGEPHPESYESLAAEIESSHDCCDVWLNSCQNSLYKLLKRAYSSAIADHDIAARFFLSLAYFKLRSNPNCFECSCPVDVPVYFYDFSGNGSYGSIESCD